MPTDSGLVPLAPVWHALWLAWNSCGCSSVFILSAVAMWSVSLTLMGSPEFGAVDTRGGPIEGGALFFVQLALVLN